MGQAGSLPRSPDKPLVTESSDSFVHLSPSLAQRLQDEEKWIQRNQQEEFRHRLEEEEIEEIARKKEADILSRLNIPKNQKLDKIGMIYDKCRSLHFEFIEEMNKVNEEIRLSQNGVLMTGIGNKGFINTSNDFVKCVRDEIKV